LFAASEDMRRPLNLLRFMSRPRWLPESDLLCAMLFVLAHGALLLAWPVMLAQDGPNWIAEAALLYTFVQTHAAGDCQLVTALPPNALSQGVIGLLCWVVAPELAGRFYIVLCVGLFAAALVYLCRARPGAHRQLVVVSCLPLCVGYPLFHGFLNYMAALPALCWGMGSLLRNPEGRGLRGTSQLLIMPLLTYLCHGTAVGIWAVLVFVQIAIRRSHGFTVRALLGFVPVVWLIEAYARQRSAEGAGVLWTAGGLLATVAYRLRSPLRFFSVFPGFVPTFADPALGWAAPVLTIVNVGYALAVVGCGLRWAWRARRASDLGERWLSCSLLVLTGLFVLMPHNVAKMLNPAERLLLPAACLAAAGLAGRPGGHQSAARRRAWLRYAVYTLLFAQWAYLAAWGTQAASLADAFVQTRERYLNGPGVQVILADEIAVPAEYAGASPWSAVQLMPDHQVLIAQGRIEDWAHGRPIVTPDTGLFRCPPHPAAPTDLAGLRSVRQVLLLIGHPERAAALARALESHFRVTRPGPGFWTLTPLNLTPSSSPGD
jgi:hypothetical protein